MMCDVCDKKALECWNILRTIADEDEFESAVRLKLADYEITAKLCKDKRRGLNE